MKWNRDIFWNPFLILVLTLHGYEWSIRLRFAMPSAFWYAFMSYLVLYIIVFVALDFYIRLAPYGLACSAPGTVLFSVMFWSTCLHLNAYSSYKFRWFDTDLCSLTISVLQPCCAATTEYGIPSDFVRKLTALLQIKISTAQLNFSNRNVIIFWK